MLHAKDYRPRFPATSRNKQRAKTPNYTTFLQLARHRSFGRIWTGPSRPTAADTSTVVLDGGSCDEGRSADARPPATAGSHGNRRSSRVGHSAVLRAV